MPSLQPARGTLDQVNRPSAGHLRQRYDSFAIALHWATAILVLTQFVLSQAWDFFPRPEKHLLIVAHMSFGILLSVVLLVRIAWRLAPSHHVAPASSGLLEFVAQAAHYILYALLVAEAVLGYVLRWSGNESMSFFGLQIPPPFAPFSKDLHHLVGETHAVIGWTIVIVAACHALAALFHHYVLRDGVLLRMLPRRGA
ncbi:MAG TPA: cytochrome b [Rhodopila sp.]|uniref:cytochrome b n=1 Tax=Rhodopila sp. TaxID=2480087 RepID=UPI002C874CE8|nr:cytochrome b [Rhodopila sp.]HVY16384.1 cytochrome b [Rhodopila sp.]